ncbi:hypothetical protein RND71_038531 [Anisodus tanguticus]|uniref:Uncharacterized protein n=1 Tax=Anisodus tanguticus TaxID=243964 RepID=A0AAE1UZJ8_9SOLA|nr:hypothetical protein RND71_038531 [Anisodus tanguticus]
MQMPQRPSQKAKNFDWKYAIHLTSVLSKAKSIEKCQAYDILSDEDKRKNYDIYGDEKRAPGFDTGGAGDHGGYTYFTSGGPGQSGFNFGPGGMGDKEVQNHFHFPLVVLAAKALLALV